MRPLRSRALPALLVAAAGALVAHLAGACSATAPSPSPVEEDGGAPPPPTADAKVRDTSAADVPPKPGPLEGWVKWEDYVPGCGFSIPSEPKYLPAPLRWEPCVDTPTTRKLSCRRIALDWPGKWSTTQDAEFINPGTRAFVREDGTVLLGTTQYYGSQRIDLVAEVDGPVKVAVHSQTPTLCLLVGSEGNGSHYAFRVFESDGERISGEGGGAIGGHIDDFRPKKLVRFADKRVHSVLAGNAGFIDFENGGFALYTWTDPTTRRPIWSAANEGTSLSQLYFFNDFFFWAADGPSSKEQLWTPESGVKDFVNFGADRTRGAGDLGTDGKAWVWVEGEEAPPGYPYKKVKLVTAPFTRDPAKLQKRVLRTDLTAYPFGLIAFAVGHGYAGRSLTRSDGDGGYVNGTLIARLADGSAWHLPGGTGASPSFQEVLAITETEVFLRVREAHPGTRGRTNIYRVRLDSLGDFALPPP